MQTEFLAFPERQDAADVIGVSCKISRPLNPATALAEFDSGDAWIGNKAIEPVPAISGKRWQTMAIDNALMNVAATRPLHVSQMRAAFRRVYFPALSTRGLESRFPRFLLLSFPVDCDCVAGTTRCI